MEKKKINYNEFTLDPDKEVLVPMHTYLALTNVIQGVEKKHSTRIRSDKYSYFNRATHAKLSNKNKVKMAPEKLAKEYYENIDLDKTSKNIRVDRDELGSAAIQLLGEFRGIFELNVDKGNCILKEVAKPSNLPAGLKVVKDTAPTENDGKNEGKEGV